MAEHFNKLSPQTQELLVMLAEEANEIGLAVAKALRHGLNSMHPDVVTDLITDDHIPDNRYDIAKECGDLIGVMNRLVKLGVLDNMHIAKSSMSKMQRAKPYLHHQVDYIL